MALQVQEFSYGLSSSPEMIIVKNLMVLLLGKYIIQDYSSNNVLLLNSTSAEANPSTDFNNGGLGICKCYNIWICFRSYRQNNVNESGLDISPTVSIQYLNIARFRAILGMVIQQDQLLL